MISCFAKIASSRNATLPMFYVLFRHGWRDEAILHVFCRVFWILIALILMQYSFCTCFVEQFSSSIRVFQFSEPMNWAECQIMRSLGIRKLADLWPQQMDHNMLRQSIFDHVWIGLTDNYNICKPCPVQFSSVVKSERDTWHILHRIGKLRLQTLFAFHDFSTISHRQAEITNPLRFPRFLD